VKINFNNSLRGNLSQAFFKSTDVLFEYREFIPSCFQTLNLSVIESLLGACTRMGIMQAVWILLFDS